MAFREGHFTPNGVADNIDSTENSKLSPEANDFLAEQGTVFEPRMVHVPNGVPTLGREPLSINPLDPDADLDSGTIQAPTIDAFITGKSLPRALDSRRSSSKSEKSAVTGRGDVIANNPTDFGEQRRFGSEQYRRSTPLRDPHI